MMYFLARLCSVVTAAVLFTVSVLGGLFGFGAEKRYFDSLSETQLNAVLDRAVSHFYFHSMDERYLAASKKFVLETGAKYIARANTMWVMYSTDAALIARQAAVIADVHASDPEIIFEACIFETVYTSVEEIPIPAYVFEAFGLKPENRCFDYESMIFKNGKYVDQWCPGGSVPDITRIETQMFFYYRATLFIDAGFEALHMGQIHLYASADKNYKTTTGLYNMIRTYAASHARRGWVLLNAHTHGDYGADGLLLFDFHTFPSRVNEPKGSVAHPASAGAPQRAIYGVNELDSIYGKSRGGMTHAGWFTGMLPYLVELDNWAGYDPSLLDKPDRGTIWTWGFDEISWFANQPSAYQREFLLYAHDWVTQVDGSKGHIAMPGTRGAAIKPVTR
ncbi:MAG TPA: hypothetical protein PL044_09885 [Clostridiales bacterium]|nr:hypothetical protein [Clostridiales bacterium]